MGRTRTPLSDRFRFDGRTNRVDGDDDNLDFESIFDRESRDFLLVSSAKIVCTSAGRNTMSFSSACEVRSEKSYFN